MAANSMQRLTHYSTVHKRGCILYICPQDKLVAFHKISSMYLKYIQIFRKLEECYDQVTHPQKRRPLRHILDGTMGRCVRQGQGSGSKFDSQGSMGGEVRGL